METKKKITLPIKIIVIGCIIGIIIASIGGIRQIGAKKTNEERKKSAIKASKEAVKNANAKLKEMEKEYNSLKEESEKKNLECDAMNIRDADWFEKHSKCQREASEMQERLNNLEIEATAIKNRDYTGYYDEVEPMSYQLFYIIGASIAGVSIIGAFIIYLVKGKKSY